MAARTALLRWVSVLQIAQHGRGRGRPKAVYQIVTGDFNGDGKPDLAMVIGEDPYRGWIEPTPVVVFENLGDGTFGAPVISSVGGKAMEFATAIAAGDFNGDGVTDIAVGTSCEASPYPVAVNVLLSECE